MFGYMQKTLVLQTTRFPLALALVFSLNIRATATTTIQRFYITDDYIFVCAYMYMVGRYITSLYSYIYCIFFSLVFDLISCDFYSTSCWLYIRFFGFIYK